MRTAKLICMFCGCFLGGFAAWYILPEKAPQIVIQAPPVVQCMEVRDAFPGNIPVLFTCDVLPFTLPRVSASR